MLGEATIYTLSNFAVAAVPLLLLPFITRVLEPHEYAIISMFTLIVSFFSVGIGLNIQGSITVRYFDGSNFNIPYYLTSTFYISLFMSMLMFATVFILGSSIEKLTNVPIFWQYVAVVVASCQFATQLLLIIWQVTKKPIQFGFLRLTQAIIDCSVSVLLVLMVLLSWKGRLAGMAAGWVFACLFALYFLHKKRWLTKTLDISSVVDSLKFGVPLLPHAIGSLVLALSDRLLVNTLIDPHATGIYVVAVQIGLVLNLLADSFNKAYAPWLLEKLKERNRSVQKKIILFTYAYFISILITAILFSILARLTLDVFIGDKFLGVGDLLIYVFIGNAFTGMYYMVTNYIFYSRKTFSLSLLTIFTGVVTIIINWYLISVNGLMGAALGFMLGQIILFLGAWLLASRCYKMPWALRFSN